MVNLWICVYGKGLEVQLWTRVLLDLKKYFTSKVFLGQKGSLSGLLGPDEMLAPDDWANIIESFHAGPVALQHYSQFTGSTSFSIAMQDIYKTMERRDYSGTFRSLDKEVVARVLILYYISRFVEHEIGGVVFDISPHTPDSMIVYQVAKFLEIPTLAFEICGIAPVRFPVTDMSSEKRFYKTEASLSKADIRNPETEALIEKDLEKSWLGFQDLDHVQDYVVTQRVRSRKKSIIAIRRWKGLISVLRSKDGQTLMTFFGSDWGANARASIGWFLQKSLRARLARAMELASLPAGSSEGGWVGGALDGGQGASPMDESPGGRHPGRRDAALFALHYEPESTTFPQGIPVRNQLDAVIEARRLLGDNKQLLVKEHPSQMLRANEGYLGRSNLFYSAVRGLPNTRIVPDGISAKKLMGFVDVIFTLTGTVAFEGLSQGKQIIHFGSPWWEGCPGTTKALFGSVTDDSEPVFSRDSISLSEAWMFALQKVLSQGIFYPDKLIDSDEVTRAVPELAAILCHWLQYVSGQVGTVVPESPS